MCGRQAALKKQSLPLRFWQISKYKLEYLKQLRFANTLFKLYRPAAISLALRSPQGKKVYSLGAKWFDEAVKAADAKLASDEAALKEIQAKPPEPAPTGPLPQTRPAFKTGQSTASKLKGL